MFTWHNHNTYYWFLLLKLLGLGKPGCSCDPRQDDMLDRCKRKRKAKSLQDIIIVVNNDTFPVFGGSFLLKEAFIILNLNMHLLKKNQFKCNLCVF